MQMTQCPQHNIIHTTTNEPGSVYTSTSFDHQLCLFCCLRSILIYINRHFCGHFKSTVVYVNRQLILFITHLKDTWCYDLAKQCYGKYTSVYRNAASYCICQLAITTHYYSVFVLCVLCMIFLHVGGACLLVALDELFFLL